MGKFEQADQGTLFLDEIGDMPMEIQVKLLRTLQDGSFSRVGGNTAKQSDFRLISASNRNFKDMLHTGTFRLDLFYRISPVTLRVPSLRERPEDIPLLVDMELKNFTARHGIAPKKLAPDVIPYLQSLPWPGNVRQLQHVIGRAVIFAGTDIIHIQDLEPSDDPHAWPTILAEQYREPQAKNVTSTNIHTARAEVETDLIRDAMQKLGGNKKKVAEQLGISRSYLYKRLTELG